MMVKGIDSGSVSDFYR